MAEKLNRSEVLLTKYFEENRLVEPLVKSFNRFIEKELPKIINENKEIVPTIIPQDVDEFKIRFEKIWVTKPEIIEADGSKRPVYPTEARLRKLSYAAPMYLEVSAIVNGVQRENFVTQIGNIPIMLNSKFCHLSKLNKNEKIKLGEDPDDPGGYFIINGTEKTLVIVEDLAPNRLIIEKTPTAMVYTGRLFSEKESYKIPHLFEKHKDGTIFISFTTRIKRLPIIVLIKALGLDKDSDISAAVSQVPSDELILNLYEQAEVPNQDAAIDFIAKKIGIIQAKEIRVERVNEILNKYLLPHLGTTAASKYIKAYNLCKIMKRLIDYSREDKEDDKDHYYNKRLKLPGDLLSDLFRVNMRVLVSDLLYNFQRIVKRGKTPSVRSIIREKLLTERIYSAMATGNWVGSRKGVSQRTDRVNFLATQAHLQKVSSPLSASQENFEARELHPTHMGRLCIVDTPEGQNIGLKKNLAMLCSISQDVEEGELIKVLENIGVNLVKPKTPQVMETQTETGKK